MRPRNAGIKKLRMPAHNSYARQSADQDAIDDYLAKHGAREAVNTGKVFSFNGRGNRSKGHVRQTRLKETQKNRGDTQQV